MSYNIFDTDKSVESLTKEFNRTQRNITKALRTDNQKEYDRLLKYRNDIRHIIKLKEGNNAKKDINLFALNSNNRATTSTNRGKEATI